MSQLLHPSFTHISLGLWYVIYRMFFTLQASVVHFHHWREGNLPPNSKCVACKKTCWSSECLAGMRCEWCGVTVSHLTAHLGPACARMHTRTHAHSRTHTHMHTHTHTHAHSHTHTQRHTHSHRDAHTRTQRHTRTHTHVLPPTFVHLPLMFTFGPNVPTADW